MSNGISGYNGRIDLYRQLESISESGLRKSAAGPLPDDPKQVSRSSLGGDLSDAESRMIQQYFPESDGLTLRLYGQRTGAETVDPQNHGRRLDIRG